MPSQEGRNFDAPDEVRQFAGHGHVDLVKLENGPVGLGTFEPGWRWSVDVKPLAGTDTCQVHHVGYVISGRMKVVGDDGSEVEVGPGDVFSMPPGHDAWTVGDEACVLVDFGGLQGYAVPH
jgi:ethanolamine utilization protein EutQ (cupin superfamily)